MNSQNTNRNEPEVTTLTPLTYWVQGAREFFTCPDSPYVNETEAICQNCASRFAERGYLDEAKLKPVGSLEPLTCANCRYVQHETRYALIETRAPKAYDYDYCVDFPPMKDTPEGSRVVAIPLKSVDYQTGRYLSGMYYAKPV